MTQLPVEAEPSRRSAQNDGRQGARPREVIAARQAAGQAERDAQTQLESQRTLLARTAWDADIAALQPSWGEQHRNDHITAAKSPGALDAVYRWLMVYDLTGFNHKRAPESEALKTMVALSVNQHEEFTAGFIKDNVVFILAWFASTIVAGQDNCRLPDRY
jgi:hypothetical protein